jgi:hypothetical protein
VSGSGNFGGDDYGFPRHSLHPASENFFGSSAGFCRGRDGVHFGSIEEVDTGGASPVHDPKGQWFIALAAEGHGPHADLGNGNATATQSSAFHVFTCQNQRCLRPLPHCDDSGGRWAACRACLETAANRHRARLQFRELPAKVRTMTLRIISGKYRRRLLKTPADDSTRPIHGPSSSDDV